MSVALTVDEWEGDRNFYLGPNTLLDKVGVRQIRHHWISDLDRSWTSFTGTKWSSSGSWGVASTVGLWDSHSKYS